MRVKEYPVLKRAVAVGVKQGWARAHQQDQEPNDDATMEKIRDSVLAEICEAFEFDADLDES